MMYYFITTKENVELAREEVKSLIFAYDEHAEIEYEGRLIIVKTNKDLTNVSRATMLRYVAKEIKLDEIKSIKSFGCKVINLTDNKIDTLHYIDMLVRKIKTIVKDSKISLDKPDALFCIIVSQQGRYYEGRLLDITKIRLKKVVRHPAELKDKLALLMINLAGVKERETLLDPCCGTGTILLYASYYKINSIGCDISLYMCKSSIKNLEANGLTALVINADSTKLPINKVDVVVSNLPYGKASSTFGLDSKTLVKNIVEECRKISKKVVFMCKRGDEPESMKKYYDLYVHKNLSRRLIICR